MRCTLDLFCIFKPGDALQRSAVALVQALRPLPSGGRAVPSTSASDSQPPVMPPPSYDTVVRSSGSSKKSSPLSSRVSSPQHSSRYQAYRAEEEQNAQGSEAASPPWQGTSRKPRRANSMEGNQTKVRCH